jgi:Protein of unknown function (DUF4246)
MSLEDQLLKLWPRGRPLYSVIGNGKVNTLPERRIRSFTAAIREKPLWRTKIDDKHIQERWRKEASEQGMTKEEFDYALEELRYWSSLHKEGGVYLTPADHVWASDVAIDNELKAKLMECGSVLEDIPDHLKDWHPGSNNQVLNLFHPSLYPLIYGRSYLLDKPIETPKLSLVLSSFGAKPKDFKDWQDIKEGAYRVIPIDVGKPHDRHLLSWDVSQRFCWLPTDFDVSETGHVSICSYINNLHPVEHENLYPIIAEIFGKFLPLLEQVVTDVVYPRLKPRVPFDIAKLWTPVGVEPEDQNYPTWDDYYEAHEAWRAQNHFNEPQPGSFEIPDRPNVPHSLLDRRLQAIVKMSNILLTPENPEYQGGNWHVEAMANERIIATGIYYYDSENITESNLNFRETVDETMGIEYEQDDALSIERLYGLQLNDNREAELVQEVGRVTTKQGRCIVFPNFYQHKVSGFKLKDPSKAGHRKILVFFFVDPATPIPSTSVVPPQQQEWWDTGSALEKLPVELVGSILDKVEFPISHEDAKTLRLELMEERKKPDDDERSFNPVFYMCEH